MPLTLYRYILREMLKLLAAATGVLMVVMSFGAAIKPISEGMLGPWELVRLIFYLMPGMLTFALPFASAFASTLVFFRMSADNEITACAASGVSYRSMLLPVATLGLVLTLSLFFLSNWVIPTFWQNVARIVEKDVTRLIVQQLKQREAVAFSNLLVYADRAVDNYPVEGVEPGQPRPYNRIVLDGVAVGKRERRTGEITADYTAERAVVDLYRGRDRIYATMMLTNVTINDPEAGYLVTVARQPVEAQEIPVPFQQQPKFMSLPQLKELSEEPDLSGEVQEMRQDLAEALAVQRTINALFNRLRTGERDMTLLGPRGERYLISTTAKLVGQRLLELGGAGRTVRVRVLDDGLVRQRLEAEAGRIEVSPDALGGEPQIKLTLNNVTVTSDPNLPTQQAQVKQIRRAPLQLDEPIYTQLKDKPSLALLKQAEESGYGPVNQAAKALSRERLKLRRDILSRLHERAATAVACVLVLLLGAVMSIWMREQVPLAIFFWCFVPTVMGLLMISSGQNMIDSIDFSPSAGIALTWGANGLLAAMVFGVYWRLNRV